MKAIALGERTIADLRSIAKNYHIPNYWNLRKQDLIEQLVTAQRARGEIPPQSTESAVAVADLSMAQPPQKEMPPSAVCVETKVEPLSHDVESVQGNGSVVLGEKGELVEATAPQGEALTIGEPDATPAPPETIAPITTVEEVVEPHIFAHGILEVGETGHGFLRTLRYLPGPDDIYVSQSQIRRFGLRTGDLIHGQVRLPKEGERFYSLLRVDSVNEKDPESALQRPLFESLTPIFPQDQLNLETSQQNLSQRLINLVAPIGRGQRGLIVSPPKAGKTMLLKQIANGITANHPEIYLMVCLIGERPEEVTDMRRSIQGEVVSSTFDEDTENHTRVAEMALDRAKRLVEVGRDVVILLDSVTRLVRAYNLAVPPSGRTLTGGVDPSALYPPKKFYGAARNLEEGGSLTIIATCLVDTGSRMDEVIYEEFKGTGNLEIHLDRRLAERRLFPAIDVLRSSTRREELLLGEATLRQVWLIRRMLQQIGEGGYEQLLRAMSRTTNNREFLRSLTKDSL
ncbi:MAG: transcription termination factor Rho [Chloroflexi bacterium]|nr:transcription termination factor Rho [Chloroflexota bacterium]